ncbi:MAG: hypothetical protein NT098_04630 [Candidatus Parcubacteria bacterium]|nr:hypothetical protein [Candidatus Parcubacteria bacterium]
MQIKSEFYEEIYFVENVYSLTERQADNLLMSGRKNREHYFLPFKTERKHEEIKNVELVEFLSENDLFAYMEKLNPFSLLNFSLEHEKPCLLKLV